MARQLGPLVAILPTYNKFMQRKTDRNNEVIRLRASGLTLKSIAEKIGVSYPRIRQILMAEAARRDENAQ